MYKIKKLYTAPFNLFILNFIIKRLFLEKKNSWGVIFFMYE